MLTRSYSLSQASIQDHIYVIRKRALEDWFFKEIQDTPVKPVCWTATVYTARLFTTEEDVEEFKFLFLKSRRCDIIMIR